MRCGFQSRTQVSFMHRPPASRVLPESCISHRMKVDMNVWTRHLIQSEQRGKTGATRAECHFLREQRKAKNKVDRLRACSSGIHFPTFCLKFEVCGFVCPCEAQFCRYKFVSLNVCEGWGEGDRLGLLAPDPLYSHFQQGHVTQVKLCHNLTRGELAKQTGANLDAAHARSPVYPPVRSRPYLFPVA